MLGPHTGTPAPRTAQTVPEVLVMETEGHKSMVPEPGWFNGNRKGFEDW